jgi:hypothetical protein
MSELDPAEVRDFAIGELDRVSGALLREIERAKVAEARVKELEMILTAVAWPRVDKAEGEVASLRMAMRDLYQALYAEQLAEVGGEQYAPLDEMCAQIRLAVVLANKAYDFAADLMKLRTEAQAELKRSREAEVKP